MLNYETSEFAPKPMEYNTIRVFVHSDIATTVRLGIGQNGDPWWFIDPNSSATYDLSVGWNELAIAIPTVRGSGDVACFAISNLGSENATFHVDALCFVTEMTIDRVEGVNSVTLNTPVDLTNFVTVSESDDYELTVSVNGETVIGQTYTFTEKGEYTIAYTALDKASGLQKELTFVLTAVAASITVPEYDNAVLNTQITVKNSEVTGAEKNVSVKLKKPDGTESDVNEGDLFVASVGGWYQTVYTLTYGVESQKSVTKTFYVGYENELASFEDIPRNGQGISDNIGTATSSVSVSEEQAYFGSRSLKFTNVNKDERAQITYDGNPTIGTAPIISDHAYNKIKMWVYSETAVSVTIAIQGGGNSDAEWGWLTSPSDVTVLQSGWQEITLDRGSTAESRYISSIFVDKKTEGTNGTAESIYIDCIRFVSE